MEAKLSIKLCHTQTNTDVQLKPGRYSWEFLVGVCRPVLQILPLFQTKKCHSKGRNYVIIAKIRAQCNEYFVKREIDCIIKLSFVLIFKKRDSSVLFHYRIFTPLFSRTIVRSLNQLHS